MQDLEPICDSIREQLHVAEADLIAAKDASVRVPEIEADIERLSAALKSLSAPQSPAGRKRIGDAAKRRKKARPEESPVVVRRVCAECRHLFDEANPATFCGAEGCDAAMHGLGCAKAHRDRWHGGAADEAH